jgi:predicted dehydrogenase
MVNIAQVGVGYWGPNVLRNLTSFNDVNLSTVCDIDAGRASKYISLFCPGAKTVSDCTDILKDRSIEAVVITTPVRTHFDLARNLLQAGKHVLVEKPLAETAAECKELIRIAEEKNLVLMVGHVFEFNAAVRRVKEYLEAGELGELLYVYSHRLNLGRIQNDISALWSLGPHDVSIMNYWLGSEPLWIKAHGFSYINKGIADVVFATLEYPGNIGLHLHVGWLDPHKLRTITLVGSKKMLVYDDVSADTKLMIYDKGVKDLDSYLKAPESFAEFQLQLRAGDVLIPSLKFNEPLNAECRHFVDCVKQGSRPLTDGWNGLRVVKVLEAAEKSMQNGGAAVHIGA